jgi:hypothetical protein
MFMEAAADIWPQLTDRELATVMSPTAPAFRPAVGDTHEERT